MSDSNKYVPQLLTWFVGKWQPVDDVKYLMRPTFEKLEAKVGLDAAIDYVLKAAGYENEGTKPNNFDALVEFLHEKKFKRRK